MQVRTSAFIIGLLFILLGIAGFVPALVTIPESIVNAPIDNAPNALNTGYGYLFGLFPTNYIHNAIHITVGILGIAAFTTFGGSSLFLRGFAIAYFAIALMGIFPILKTVFGTVPIYGNNVWFNAVTAIIAGYFGFIKSTEERSMGLPS